MNDLRLTLLEAQRDGNFLEVVVQSARGEKDNREHVTEELIALHNAGEIDLIDQFIRLHNKKNTGPDFFLTRNLFEKALPHLNAPIQKVMECVAHLVKEAGQDMAANWTLNSFIEHCVADPSRANEALSLIKNDPDQWGDFISPIIVAGTRDDLKYYFAETVNLASHEKIEIRKRAVYALGRINYQHNSELLNEAIDCLEKVVARESDDHLLGNSIKSICSICRPDHSKSGRAIEILNEALAKGGDLALHAASEEFGFNINELPEDLIDIIMHYLMRVNPNNKGTLDNIDYGVLKLLERDDPNSGIEFLENLLLANAESLTLKSFDSAIHGILGSKTNILNKIITRWLLKGDRVLCEGIREILHSIHGNDLVVELDTSELSQAESMQYMFIARKTIGYLFFKPVTCASIIISLMRQTNDLDLVKELGSLLFDPLLLNYSGSLYEYLKSQVDNESGETKTVILSSLREFDSYLEGLKSVGRIPEMFSSQDHRDAHARHLNQLFSEPYKEAMKNSIVNLICTKSLLLYGRKSINYFQHPTSGPQRTELELKNHGTEVEFPRQEHLDPFGLDYMLRLFRAEKQRIT